MTQQSAVLVPCYNVEPSIILGALLPRDHGFIIRTIPVPRAGQACQVDSNLSYGSTCRNLAGRANSSVSRHLELLSAIQFPKFIPAKYLAAV